jgi:hypothetical protein
VVLVIRFEQQQGIAIWFCQSVNSAKKRQTKARQRGKTEREISGPLEESQGKGLISDKTSSERSTMFYSGRRENM